MIPKDTPFKVVKYLVKLYDEKLVNKNYEDNKLIIHLLDRGLINGDIKNKFRITEKFKEKYDSAFLPAYLNYSQFIKRYKIENLENYCTVEEIEQLIGIELVREENINLSLQQILSKYFKSSKYATNKSNLSDAIKKILRIEDFESENKDFQYLSILYPSNTTGCIILCENKDRIRCPRHSFIEYWYSGGRNTSQLQFVPKPSVPILYLFDWDYEGVHTYLHIKENYFSKIRAFVPNNYRSLVVGQKDVKHHKSQWESSDLLEKLHGEERRIVKALIDTNSIIEEQRILVNEENLAFNMLS